MKMDVGEIERMFIRADGQYLFARWGRPVCPVVFGVDDATLDVIRAALNATVELAGHEMGDVDAELGSNLMIFFFEDWAELTEVPGMDRLVPELDAQIARLAEAGANQYRFFRFDEAGAIKACFSFIRMDDSLREVSAQVLALSQAVQAMLLWADTAFAERSPLAAAGDNVMLRPDVAAVLRAAYDPVMPVAARDASHALRLMARLEVNA